MCYALPILKTEEEFLSLDDAPSVNAVTDVPDNFKQWVRDNSNRIISASEKGKLPYFLRDNSNSWNKVLFPERYEQSDNYRGNFFARKLNDIQTNLIARKFKDIKTSDELKSISEILFSEAIGNKVEITIDDKLMPLPVAKAHLTELLSIVREYEIKQGKLTDIILGYIPEDERIQGMTIYTPQSDSKKIYLTENIEGRDSSFAERNSRCDKSRLPFSLASHEGGHLLFCLDTEVSKELLFLKQSVINIWNEYYNEFYQLSALNKIQQRADIFIGVYGHNSNKIGEFMAECFQEYRNCKIPSKYALKIGKLMDSYFKK